MNETDKEQLVIAAVTELIGNGNPDGVGPLLRDDFIEHNSQIATSTRTDWIAAFRAIPLQGMRIDIDRLFAEGEYITMFSRRWLPNGDIIAVADVFRFDHDLVAEHWEVVQPIADGQDNPLVQLRAGSGSGSNT